MAERKFQIVEDETPEPETVSRPHRAQPVVDKLATEGLLLALNGLSKRAIAAVRDIFTLLSVGSAFWLWFSIPNPSVTQIVALSIYAVFILAANVIVRKV